MHHNSLESGSKRAFNSRKHCHNQEMQRDQKRHKNVRATEQGSNSQYCRILTISKHISQFAVTLRNQKCCNNREISYMTLTTTNESASGRVKDRAGRMVFRMPQRPHAISLRLAKTRDWKCQVKRVNNISGAVYCCHTFRN